MLPFKPKLESIVISFFFLFYKNLECLGYLFLIAIILELQFAQAEYVSFKAVLLPTCLLLLLSVSQFNSSSNSALA